MISAFSLILTAFVSAGPVCATKPMARVDISVEGNFHRDERVVRRSRIFPTRDLKQLSSYKDDRGNSLLLYYIDITINLDDDLELALLKEKLTKTLTRFTLVKTGRHKARGRHIRYFKFVGKRLVFYFFVAEDRGKIIFGELTCSESRQSDEEVNAVMLSLRKL
jgi:hypothetical protein